MLWYPEKVVYNVLGLFFVGVALVCVVTAWRVKLYEHERLQGLLACLVSLALAYSILEDVYLYGEKAFHGIVTGWAAAIVVTTWIWRRY